MNSMALKGKYSYSHSFTGPNESYFPYTIKTTLTSKFNGIGKESRHKRYKNKDIYQLLITLHKKYNVFLCKNNSNMLYFPRKLRFNMAINICMHTSILVSILTLKELFVNAKYRNIFIYLFCSCSSCRL